VQEHDADLNCTCEHQNNGEANVQVNNSRTAPVEGPVELFALFSHTSPAGLPR
jgi:hypothetical protein